MWTLNGTYYYAQYQNFKVSSESEGYQLQVSGEYRRGAQLRCSTVKLAKIMSLQYKTS